MTLYRHRGRLVAVGAVLLYRAIIIGNNNVSEVAALVHFYALDLTDTSKRSRRPQNIFRAVLVL